ncbi:hypothetical protein B0T25DRAFT_530876 [Lasiosphaeria hispida]|uniref:C2H2-type domain-containing protein n=1 Tax=Lasiosphaeria hispida TaxID=260671 RepID=A0AAJ0HNZ9_9PEZI
MEPFIVLLPFHLLVCKLCKRAIPVDEITTHLPLWNNQQELQNFTVPKEPILAIDLLQAPLLDGLKCNSCSYIVCNVQKIQTHCHMIHNWVNPNKKGHQIKGSEPHDMPWRSGVPCQQFFQGRHGSALFEVILPSAHTAVTQ